MLFKKLVYIFQRIPKNILFYVQNTPWSSKLEPRISLNRLLHLIPSKAANGQTLQRSVLQRLQSQTESIRPLGGGPAISVGYQTRRGRGKNGQKVQITLCTEILTTLRKIRAFKRDLICEPIFVHFRTSCTGSTTYRCTCYII